VRLLGFVALSLYGLAVGPAVAGPDDRPTQLAQDTVSVVLDTIERRIIGDYYESRYRQWYAEEGGQAQGKAKGKNKKQGLPPGLAKKGTLPPGLYNQLVANGELPPGLQRDPLPADLLRQLPPRPIGQTYYIADDKVLLVEAATNLILDVLTVAAADAD
jgi:hypothetical protein